jgi:putative flippase GtrA
MTGATMSGTGAPRLSRQLWRYAATGVLNTGLGLAVIFSLHLGAGLDIPAANAIGYAVGWLVSYAVNRSWTFGHRGRIGPSLLAYAALVLAAFAANIALISTALAWGLPYIPAQLLGVAFYSVAVFIGAKHVVFLHRA